jgi:glycosyltransferase involved in cell wall biosynthesis
MNVAYLGPLKDYSGYGEANRHAVAALHTAGVKVIGKLVSYSQESADFGNLGALVNDICNNDGDYKIKILHTTPDQYKRYMDPGKYHVGHFFWETDKVPADFAAGLNTMDEIWTGSHANKDALEKGGVTKPIFIFPQAIETDREWPLKYEIPEFPESNFLFYSIFEWTDRKNPEALLNAYWETFEGKKDVGLLIKTYFRNFTMQNRRMIRHEIEVLKAKSSVKDFPPVFLYMDLMDRQQVMRIHMTGDCYVSPHRGEGWGLPIVEAALAGNPVIATTYGGAAEWMNKKSSILGLNYNLEPLQGMDHASQWYDRDQNWADPSEIELKAYMKSVYDSPTVREAYGHSGRQFVLDNFNLERVGNEMAHRLREIERDL